jgi:hypothetical protein
MNAFDFDMNPDHGLAGSPGAGQARSMDSAKEIQPDPVWIFLAQILGSAVTQQFKNGRRTHEVLRGFA